MEKITLKLGDRLQLESELNGFIDPETGKEIYIGFLKQDIPILLKYELTELCEELVAERKRTNVLRDELVKKYGEDDGKGGMAVLMRHEVKNDEGVVIGYTINPKYIEFDKEYGELLQQEKEITYPEINKQILKEAGKSKDPYRVLFKLIKKEKEGAN